jgi:hypothetical protein
MVTLGRFGRNAGTGFQVPRLSSEEKRPGLTPQIVTARLLGRVSYLKSKLERILWNWDRRRFSQGPRNRDPYISGGVVTSRGEDENSVG